MPGPTVKEILLKFGIDSTNWKKAITELGVQLEKANKDSAKAQDQSQKRLEAQKAKLKEIIADRKSETAELEKQIGKMKLKAVAAGVAKAEASATLVSHKAASAEIGKQATTQKQLQAIQKTLQQEVYTKLMNEKLVTAEINKQNAALRLQTAQQRAAGGGGAGGRGGGGGFRAPGGKEGGFLTAFAGGFASRLAGTIGFAVFSAEGLGRVLEELTKKMREFIESTGPLQQVQEQFQKLSESSGRNPAKFIDDLRKATHGLVEDIDLYRAANTFMQSGIQANEKDIVQLTQATVGLARAQGRDAASAVQALNNFFLSGRGYALAYATGIQRTQLEMRGIARGAASATMATIAFKQAQQAIVSQFQAIGEPTLTFTDRLRQLSVASKTFWEEFTLGLIKSKGFQSFLDDIGSLAEQTSSLLEKASAWGESIGEIFTAFSEALKTVKGLFLALNDVVEGLYSVISATFGESSISSGFLERLSSVKDLAITTAQAFVLLKGAADEIGLRIEYTLKEANNLKEFLHIGPATLHKEFLEKLQASQNEEMNELARLEGRRKSTAGPEDYRIRYSAPSNVYTQSQQEDAARKIAKAKEQIAVEESKIELEQTQTRIKDEEELVQEQYEQGLLTIKEYLAKKGELELQDHQAKLKQLKDTHDATMQYLAIEQRETRQLAELKKEQADLDAQTQLASIDRQKTEISLRLQEDVAKKVITPGQATTYATTMAKQAQAQTDLVKRSQAASKQQADADLAEQNANRLVEQKKYLASIAAENAKYKQQGHQLTEQEIKDEIEARQKLSDEIQKIDKARVELAKQNTEYEFQQGEISAQEYLDKRVQYINEEYDATKEAADRRLEANKNSESAQAEFSQKLTDAEIARQKELTKLSNDEVEIRMKAVESSYDRAQKLIESQLSYQQSLDKTTSFGGGKEEERSLIEAQISLLKSRLEQEMKSLTLTKEGTEQWFLQMQKIQNTREELVKYNEELVKTNDLSTQIASAIKELSQASAKFPRGGARFASGLDILATGLEEQAKTRQNIALRQAAAKARAEGKTIAPVTPEEIFKSLQKASKEAGDDLGKHLASASASIETWRQKLEASGAALDILIAKATGKTTGTGGGVSGPSTTLGPLGTSTASDLINLMPAALSKGGGSQGLGSASQQAATGLSVVAQMSMSLKKGFDSLISTSLGDQGLVGYFKNLGKNTQAASDDLSNFADTVSSIAGEVGGLVSAAKGTGGPAQAGLQGMQAGGGLGGQIGSLFGPMGAIIGQGIGMGVGLVVGVFSGKARKEAEKLAKDITAQFNAVLTEVQQGTLGLGNAVTQEITIIQQAVEQLSGKKGGRDLLKNILPQMEQQLAQLQEQQQQVIKSFDATVEQIGAPQASQALVQPIQAIIKTYQEYILAGGNVQIANQYLQDSFKNLVTQGLDTLNSAEQDAVQNALNYNDLLIQRQQLIQDTNQQIQNVMSQGVAVMQMPSGVTKAQELEKIQLNAQNQLASLNQQIAVSQHKLDNEQKIFGLAVTRVGLETQLVQLQDAQIDKQDASTAALLQEVQAFSGATPTNLPTAMGMLGLGSNYINPSAEPGLAPVPPTPTGIQWIDEQNQLQYQQALAFYNQQKNLSPTSTIGSLAGTIPGGAQGITLPGQGPAGTTQQLGGALDALASNIAAFPAAMQTMFTDASTIINVGGALLEGIAQALGVSSTGIATTKPQALTSTGTLAKQTDSMVSATAQRQALEQNISDLSATRVQNETQLVQLKMTEIQADMERIKAWTTLLNSPAMPGTNSTTMEDLLQSVYQTRARQGFGGFNGETSNAI